MAKIPAPIDPNVRLPAAVIAAGKRSDELVAASLTTESNAPPENPEPPPAPENAPPPAPEPPPAPASIDWESRYKAMHGRFEQANNQARSAAQHNAQLQSLIANMQAHQPAPASAADVRFVTQAEQEEYGNDFFDVVGKRTREVVTPELEAVKSELNFLKSQLGMVRSEAVKSNQEKMFDALTKSIPNWRQINQDQGFLDWLALPDPYSGDIRHNLLRDAFNQNLAGRVEAFFRGYLAQEAATRPVDGATTRHAGAQPPQVDLASLAAPGRAKQQGANNNFAPDEKPIITSAQVRQFYSEVSKGLWKGRDPERVAMEQAIFAAGSDGRIRG